MYMSAAAAGQTALLPAGTGRRTVSEGGAPLPGGPHGAGGGQAVAGLSQRLAVTSLGASGGTWGGGGGSVVLPWGPRLPVLVPPLEPGQPT